MSILLGKKTQDVVVDKNSNHNMLWSKNDEIILCCECGCDNGIHIKIDTDYAEDNLVGYMSYTNGNFYRDQFSVWKTFRNKLKKIWAIIRNKDYYYSDILLTKEDFITYRNYLNSIKIDNMFFVPMHHSEDNSLCNYKNEEGSNSNDFLSNNNNSDDNVTYYR